MKTEKRFHSEILNMAKWDAISRALRDQGYAIVSDGDVSRIVRGKTGEQKSREVVTAKAVFARKTAPKVGDDFLHSPERKSSLKRKGSLQE